MTNAEYQDRLAEIAIHLEDGLITEDEAKAKRMALARLVRLRAEQNFLEEEGA